MKAKFKLSVRRKSKVVFYQKKKKVKSAFVKKKIRYSKKNNWCSKKKKRKDKPNRNGRIFRFGSVCCPLGTKPEKNPSSFLIIICLNPKHVSLPLSPKLVFSLSRSVKKMSSTHHQLTSAIISSSSSTFLAPSLFNRR